MGAWCTPRPEGFRAGQAIQKHMGCVKRSEELAVVDGWIDSDWQHCFAVTAPYAYALALPKRQAACIFGANVKSIGGVSIRLLPFLRSHARVRGQPEPVSWVTHDPLGSASEKSASETASSMRTENN